MKKILLPALLFSATMFSQSFLSVSGNVDVRSATLGSKPTNFKPALDFILKVHAVSNVGVELQGGYERFDAIGFSREMANIGYNSERYIALFGNEIDITAIPYIGGSIIHRFGKEDRIVKGEYIYGKSSHVALQVGISFRYEISDKIIFDATYELMTRPDLDYVYPTDPNQGVVGSGTVGIHYILTKN